MQRLLLVAYMLIGCAISIPYTILAGGDFNNFLFTTLIAPAAALFVFVWTRTFWHAHNNSGKDRLRAIAGISVVSGFFILPILLNGLAHLSKWLGYAKISQWLSLARYPSLIGVLALLGIALLVAQIMHDLRHRTSKDA